MGPVYEPKDQIRQIRGIGGTELVFTKALEIIELDNKTFTDVPIEVGFLDYGFLLDAIIGMDLFVMTGMVIDLNNMELHVK